MDFELRIIAGCPNSDPASELYLRALEAEGMAAGELRIREIASEDVARELAFHGSPTFVASGRDLFASGAEPALSCRVYPTPEGVAGLPPLEDLRAALRNAGEAELVAT
ncbi:hypothetical protein [Paeniglutamicibacter kerguelensis]|uniref:Thioredoxin family protein n=1 Tax=Paeniglutamicibacter kerguelensis TaxID=254788 RepID=A0ABS4XAV5_9MICC|nr:hypothetical protein [Paeniglutamicibacter kerguelensis]MBP2384819.1 hypothetical protein [Paeniglutamicibacter kerguelensis]